MRQAARKKISSAESSAPALIYLDPRLKEAHISQLLESIYTGERGQFQLVFDPHLLHLVERCFDRIIAKYGYREGIDFKYVLKAR